MAYTPLDYAKRAEECVRLANLTGDELVQGELLKLRQTYLGICEKLGLPIHEAIKLTAAEKTN